MRAVAPTQLSSGTDRSASVRQVGRRIAAVLVLVAAILGLPVMTPTATTVLAVAHAACPPDCGGGSNGSNGGPPGGGTEFMPPQMPQPPNINGGYNYPAPDQANGISIYNQPPAGQGSAPPNAASPQAGQSWQTAANGEQQPAQYQSAPHTEQLSKQFTDLQNLLKQDMDVDDPSPFHHHAPLTVHPGGTPENGVDPETGAHVLPGEGEEGGGMRQAAPKPAAPPEPKSITGMTSHGADQVATRDGHGVSDIALQNAVAHPTTPPQFVPDPYGGTYKYTGENAIVVLNGNGQVVTAWATSSEGWRHP
jgi:hypothetical protein